MFDLQLLTSDVPDLPFSFARQHAAPVAAPSVLEFHTNGKQLDLPKLKVQLLNGKMPLLV
jgi:hypothetical protein